MTFPSGQKLECIDARGAGICLRKGSVYVCLGGETSGEFVAVDCCGRFEGGLPDHQWFSSRFRPVDQPKADISVFTAMLNPQKQRVDA